MSNPRRVHLGSGSIYLRNWVNVDVWLSGSCLAANEPARVKRWITDEDRYYENSHFRDGPPLDPREFVCDAYGSWESLPFETGSVDEILSRQCFEHLSKREAHWGLMEAWRVLKPGGILRIDVPDHEEALAEYAAHVGNAELHRHELNDEGRAADEESKAEFMLRHLLGSRKDDFAYHMGSWTREKLVDFAARRGFAWVADEPNIHFYPAFCLRFQKCPIPGGDPEFASWLWGAAWQYAGNPPGTPLTAPGPGRILEVGPGDPARKWPASNVVADRDPAVVAAVGAMPGVEAYCRDVCDLHFGDREFVYVLASHVLEHCADPEKACKELSRVAPAGCIVCPSPMKEGLFGYHEPDHKWIVLKAGPTLYFIEADRNHRAAVADPYAQSILHKLLRLGAPQFGPDGGHMRQWFRRVEPHLDTIHHWAGSIDVRVITIPPGS